MSQEKLLQLKEEIEEAKTNVAQLTGQKNTLMAQLKKDWKCTTLGEAKKKLKDLQKQIDDLNSQIEQGIEELETKYDFE